MHNHDEISSDMSIIALISGVSGAGKGALIERLRGRHGFHKYVTVTTRRRRGYEIDGEHYHFKTAEEFHLLRRSNKLLEWAEIHGKGLYYGTPLEPLESSLRSGARWLLDIDIQGHDSILRHSNDAVRKAKVSFFLKVSIDDLAARIRGRQPDISQSELDARIATAAEEEKKADCYDYQIENPNGGLTSAVARVSEILEHRMMYYCSSR